MKGGAADGAVPDAVIEFDFVWNDEQQMEWAARYVQATWRAWRARAVCKKEQSREALHG